MIVPVATQYKIDPNLVAAVMMVESGGYQNAISSSGAIGLMQIMPFHSCSTFDPAKNIECGVYLLAYYQQRAEGDWRDGLAAYNAGETGRDIYGNGLLYADRVLSLYSHTK